jgi:hypothetical protein
MSQAVSPQYTIFYDLNGMPLDGVLYIGVAGSNPVTSPQQAYWDSALTIPAPTPIVLRRGAPQRNGKPAAVYVSNTYSITLMDRQGRIVYTQLSLSGSALQGVSVVPTVAALRALSTTSNANNTIELLGYYNVGDDGGPDRYWSGGHAPGYYIDNGGSVIVPTGGDGSGAWLWSYVGEINVRWFGMRAQVGEDQYTRLNYCINNYDSVFIPSGRYEISGTINLQRWVHNVRGEGNSLVGTILQPTASQALFEHTAATFPILHFSGLYLDFPYTPIGGGMDFPTGGGNGFYFHGVSSWPEHSIFEQLTIVGAGIAIRNNTGTYATAFRNILINHCTNGVNWTSGTTLTFDSVLIGNVQVGWFFSNVLGFVMNSCSCDQSNASRKGLYTSAWANRFVSCQSVVINGFAAEGNVISGNDTSFFWLDNCLGFTINGVYMLGTLFDGLVPADYTSFQFVKSTLNTRAVINGWMTQVYGGVCSYQNAPNAIYFLYSSSGCNIKMVGCRLANLTKLDSNANAYLYQALGGDTWSEMCEIDTAWNQANLVFNEEVYASAAPTTGPHFIGEKIWNLTPAANGTLMWICTASGTPGTWYAVPVVVETTGTGAPVSGTHVQGEKVWNTSPTPAGTLLWVCTSSGTPGTWTVVTVN